MPFYHSSFLQYLTHTTAMVDLSLISTHAPPPLSMDFLEPNNMFLNNLNL
jgi:hypothetical protein